MHEMFFGFTTIRYLGDVPKRNCGSGLEQYGWKALVAGSSSGHCFPSLVREGPVRTHPR